MKLQAFAALGNGIKWPCRPIDIPEWAWGSITVAAIVAAIVKRQRGC